MLFLNVSEKFQQPGPATWIYGHCSFTCHGSIELYFFLGGLGSWFIWDAKISEKKHLYPPFHKGILSESKLPGHQLLKNTLEN